jgi:pyruvate formate-lyase/glycerol dehydratase family glycyl radical enzyme
MALSSRVELLLGAHKELRHTEYRAVRELSIWDRGADPSEPIVVRKARALRLLLDEAPAVIMDHELIVGLRTLYGALDEGENAFGGTYMLPVKPATMHKKAFYPRYLTDEEAAAAQGMGVAEGGFTSHVPFGTEKVLRLGLRGVKEQAAARLTDLGEEREKAAFLKAVLLSLDAVTENIRRHTDEALRLIGENRDEARSQELKEIADTCLWVSTEPPRTFREALQLYWFCCLAMAAESQSCIPIGRFDQDLYPYLERDLDAGETTLGEAQELLECLWIKLNFESDLTTDTCRNVTLAGQGPDGLDATNTLTYMCLDASHRLRLADPKLNVRFHGGSPARLLRKCVEMVKDGLGGFPAFYNDEAIIIGLTGMGVPVEHARLYSCDGCQEIILPGKGDFYPVHTAVDLLACVQSTLGVPPYLVEPGDTEPAEPEPRDCSGFEEFMDECLRNLDAMVQAAVDEGNTRDRGLAVYSPVPFLSSTLEGCLERALDKTAGGCSYNWTGCNGQAFAAAVNSLAAIRKMVYDERLVTLSELRETLGDDWGDEQLRQFALNRAPKWGNDDDYVDEIAVRVAGHFIDEVLRHRNPRGGPYYPGIFTFHHVSRGIRSSASPDGRHAGDPVSTHLSPVAGTDKAGPTLTVNSALKVYALRPPEGTALDLRFHPTALMGEEGLAKLESLIKTFMRRGGTVVQFNVVDSETLRDAQANPEQYRSLLVRVWGFSAYFTTLTKEYQDEIIARTMHGLD